MAHLIIFVLSLLFFLHTSAGAQGIGVCYGRNSTKSPSAKKAIALCKSNNIQRIFLYDASHDALHALKFTGIEVILSVRNQDIKEIAQSLRFARFWVAMNVAMYAPYINFRCIVIGHGVIPGDPLQIYILPAMKQLQKALDFAGLSIDLSTLVRPFVLTTSYPPSEGTFGQEPNPVVPVVQFLQTNRYPLLVMVGSYYEYVSDPVYSYFPLEFALLSSTKIVVQDGPFGYTNLVDCFVDAFYSALEKVGAPDVEIIAAEMGWPAQLGAITSVINAQTHNNNLIKRSISNTGTPKRPERGLESYIFSLFTQDLLGAYLESYGLFYPNLTAVYPLDFWYSPPK